MTSASSSRHKVLIAIAVAMVAIMVTFTGHPAGAAESDERSASVSASSAIAAEEIVAYGAIYGYNKRDAAKYYAQEVLFVTFHTQLVDEFGTDSPLFDVWINRDSKAPTFSIRTDDQLVLTRLAAFQSSTGIAVVVSAEKARGADVAAMLSSTTDAELEAQFGVTFAGAGFDADSGGISLYTTDSEAAANANGAKRADLRVAGASVAVSITYDAAKPTPEATLIGGVKMQNGNAACTVGFPATRSGVKGFYTADHCFDYGSTYNWYSRPADLGTKLGSATYWASAVDVRADIMFMRLNNQSDTASTTFFGGSSSSVTPMGTFLASTDGATVCKRGISTGYTCGTIEDATYKPSSNICGGQTCNATFVNTTYSSASGDSGGPVFYSGHPMGIHCASGGIYSNYAYRP